MRPSPLAMVLAFVLPFSTWTSPLLGSRMSAVCSHRSVQKKVCVRETRGTGSECIQREREGGMGEEKGGQGRGDRQTDSGEIYK